MAKATGNPRMYLVDSHSLVFQVFHAIRDRMTSPSGLPTNAIYGFVRDLLYLRSQKPDYLICAFDREEPTFRSDLYPDYKAHRDPMPSDLSVQIPEIHKAVEALSIPLLSHPKFEADDVMATVAKVASEKGIDVFLCTSDKDCRQLIDDRVRLFNLRKRIEFGREELLADWGVTPEQVIDLQTLVGDSVDNVQGVPGIGYKTGAKLLQEFGTLDKLLDNIDKVKGKKKQESLRDSADIIGMSKQLVRLSTDVPIEFDWEGWKLAELDAERALPLFQGWGFRSLSEQVRKAAGSSAEVPTSNQGELFGDDAEMFPFGANVTEEASAESSWKGDYQLVDSTEKLDKLIGDLQQQSRFCFDLETTGLQPLEVEIVGYAISWKPGEAWYIPVQGPEGCFVHDPKKTLDRLAPLFQDPRLTKVNQNIKYDLLVLRAAGVEAQGVVGDSMVADYLLHAGERSHGMEELARRYLKHQVIPITDLIGKKSRKTPQLRMDQVPTDKVAKYAGEDADVALRLCEMLEARLDASDKAEGESELRKLYRELEIPLIDVLVEMEFNGIRLDVGLLEQLSKEMGEQLEHLEKEIYEAAGHEFNIGSLPQLRKVLFDELKLPPQKKTGVTGAPSTDQESLEKLAVLDLPGAELPKKILEHRQVSKLKSTYIDALPTMVNAKTNRVHASFNQTVAATGRLSASDPNLQNIPIRREMGQQIRAAFCAEPGWSLLMADYSQIELRLLAHFCGDEVLRKAFSEDRDVHTMVAAEIFGVAEDLVSSDMRRMAKTVNFGVLYGMSAPGLAQRLKIAKTEAENFIDAYFKRYPKVLAYQDRLLGDCLKRGYVGTILGRRRQIQGIRSNSSYRQRNQPEREAINMEIQGSAADLIKLAMLNVYQRLKDEKRRAKLLLQIHDELVLEVPPEELEDVVKLVREEMIVPVAKRLALETPLKVDVAVGPNWLETETVG